MLYLVSPKISVGLMRSLEQPVLETLRAILHSAETADKGERRKRMDGSHLLAIDQGTTGTTALVFDREGRACGRGYSEFTQYYPRPGWVEHDAEEIWRVSLSAAAAASMPHASELEASGAVGIPNQRETILAWESVRRASRSVRASVWQDRRTAGRSAASFARAGCKRRWQRRDSFSDPYF